MKARINFFEQNEQNENENYCKMGNVSSTFYSLSRVITFVVISEKKEL
jgi:hypothetical protein